MPPPRAIKGTWFAVQPFDAQSAKVMVPSAIMELVTPPVATLTVTEPLAPMVPPPVRPGPAVTVRLSVVGVQRPVAEL